METKDNAKKKVVLAFSGGLDTSFAVKYLSEDLGYEVHTAIANTGGFSEEDLAVIADKAKRLGAARQPPTAASAVIPPRSVINVRITTASSPFPLRFMILMPPSIRFHIRMFLYFIRNDPVTVHFL